MNIRFLLLLGAINVIIIGSFAMPPKQQPRCLSTVIRLNGGYTLSIMSCPTTKPQQQQSYVDKQGCDVRKGYINITKENITSKFCPPKHK